MADDMGYGDPGCYNSESKIPTPNMDKLSKQGVRFTDAHSSAAVCTPSRYGLLTGRYAWRSSLKKSVLWSGYDEPLIPSSRPTLASVLKNNGYTTAIVGKWHLGMNFLRNNHIDFVQPKTFHEKGLHGTKDVDFSRPIYNGPNYLGFDYAFVSAAGHNMEPHCYIENDFTLGIPEIWREAHDTLWPGVSAVEVHEGWMVEGWDDRKIGPDLTKKSIEFIKNTVIENKSKPFFLYLPTVSPHRPCTPPDFIKGKSMAGERGDMVAEFDWTVGEIMKILDSLKISENTILIVTSDNGGTPVSDDGKDYGHKSCGLELKGFKGGLYEGGHRVPLIIKWPNGLPKGEVNNNLFCLTDFFATFANLVGEKECKEGGEDSFNMLPCLQQNKKIRYSLVMHDYGGNFAIRKNEWKLILRGNQSTAKNELYNLKTDLGETNNLIEKHPEIEKELTMLLNQFKRQGYSNIE
jgi:arylsulfatase A-like enzyme